MLRYWSFVRALREVPSALITQMSERSGQSKSESGSATVVKTICCPSGDQLGWRIAALRALRTSVGLMPSPRTMSIVQMP